MLQHVGLALSLFTSQPHQYQLRPPSKSQSPRLSLDISDFLRFFETGLKKYLEKWTAIVSCIFFPPKEKRNNAKKPVSFRPRKTPLPIFESFLPRYCAGAPKGPVTCNTTAWFCGFGISPHHLWKFLFFRGQNIVLLMYNPSHLKLKPLSESTITKFCMDIFWSYFSKEDVGGNSLSYLPSTQLRLNPSPCSTPLVEASQVERG